MKVCAEPGCPNLQAETRCPEHRRAREQARGSRQARGYGGPHPRLRADYQRRMTAGETFTCWRCGELIQPGTPWDLGHDDHDRSRYRGPEHASCNRRAARTGGG